ncbi:RDD family protein [Bacillus sp. T33-2]|uniref:RDD family protein n=1 Tax=Bacillus sp. T33-2 TaxID=2054168 RepID=UPI000C76C493|nr:RDD family protein [Bacillus sp. T33-2]PLR97477.1 hypothetical protein CVD19_08280 [Bacillus sp. T33-2]
MEANLQKQPSHEEREYAGFWIRFAASLIDSIVLGIPLSIVSMIIFVMIFGASGGLEAFLADPAAIEEGMSEEQIIAMLGAYLLTLLMNIIVSVTYFAGLHASKWQATVGKKLLGLKVTDLDGNRVSFLRALGRYLSMIFLSWIFMIGYIMAAFTKKKQALHDLIASTVVVKNK